MDITIERLSEAYEYTGELIHDVYQARNIFFEENLREELDNAYQEFSRQFYAAFENIIRNIDESDEMRLEAAGLVGHQKTLKLKSFAESYNAYRTHGTVRRLIEALKKGRTILGSLGGSIPLVGSFVQELIDFMIGALERLN